MPQANDLFKVFDVARLVEDGRITPEEIAAGLGDVEREGAYYLAAARAARVVRKLIGRDPAEYVVAYFGETYLAAGDDAARAQVIVKGALAAPHVLYLADRFGLSTPLGTPTPRELHDVASIERELSNLGRLGGATPHRRASTIASWMKTVDRLAKRR